MKRLWFNIVIFFGCFLLLITVLGAVLIMAPGMELLGVMYIRSTSGGVNESKTVTEATAYKQIYVESNNIPVYIEFAQSYDVNVHLVEVYDGFAKAGGTPSVDVEITTNGIEIKSHEYDSFLMFSREEGSGLFVKVPMYYHNKLVVNSDRSNVTFSGLGASLSDVFITTDGKVIFNNDLKVKNLELTLGNKEAVVSEDVNIQGYIIASSKRGDITLPSGFTGNVTFESTSGDLIMASCGDLIFNSKTGSIKPNGESLPKILGDAVVSTNGNVSLKSVGGTAAIEAKNGDVSIGEENGVYENLISIATDSGNINMLGTYTNEKNSISSKTGDITIGGAKDLKLETKYGNIKVDSADNVVITTKSGDVTLGSLISHSTITTNNGNVTIGDSTETKTVSGATITTVGGTITIYNASGETYNLKTNAGDVVFNQNKSAKVNLNIESKRGDLFLNNLSGQIVATTKGEIKADIYEMNGKVTLYGHNRKVSAVVHDTCYYDLSSKKNIESAPELNDKAKTYKTVPLSGSHENSTLVIETNKGKISVTKV